MCMETGDTSLYRQQLSQCNESIQGGQPACGDVSVVTASRSQSSVSLDRVYDHLGTLLLRRVPHLESRKPNAQPQLGLPPPFDTPQLFPPYVAFGFFESVRLQPHMSVYLCHVCVMSKTLVPK